jgi:SAM-dependent methyltransferase
MICPICKSTNLQFIYEFADSPATQHNLYSTLSDALKEEKVMISLYGCKDCQFVFNANFDISKIVYSSNYDNSQENSEYIQDYLQELAKRLIEKYDLKNKNVIEVGCGKGYFLKILYDLGVKNIKGFDPTYIDNDSEIDKLVIKYFFNKETAKEKADFIICRHVLEHVPNPREFVSLIEGCLSENGTMYFEFPDLGWIIKNKTFFDFFHEHYSYFTKNSAIALFNGFQNIIFNYGLKGQYFQLEISRNSVISQFIDEKINAYNKIINGLSNFAVWGAGAKGAVFLNRLNIHRDKCRYIIDINPNKQGKFIPITGQEIVSPEILGKEKIDNIIIMNSIYEKEIKTLAAKYNYKGKFILL